RIDLDDKRQLYAGLGVREYFLFDPEGLYLVPPLRGFRLTEGDLVELRSEPDGSLICQELGLRLRAEGQMLRLVDLQTGAPVLTREERAEQERRAREQAEAEVER